MLQIIRHLPVRELQTSIHQKQEPARLQTEQVLVQTCLLPVELRQAPQMPELYFVVQIHPCFQTGYFVSFQTLCCVNKKLSRS